VTIPLPVIPEVFRCALVWGFGAVPPYPVNVIHIKSVTGTLNSDAAFGALNTTLTHAMWWPTSSNLFINQVSIIKLDGTSSTVTYTTDGTARWQGVQAGDGTPQVCGIVKFATGHRGRQNRGRIYLPYAAEGAMAQGTLSGAGLSAAQTAWEAFIGALPVATPNGFVFGVASYDRAHSGAGAHFTPITTAQVETLTATQRRRQPGRKVTRHRSHV